jgi:dTDP-4-amino-4,6-dideoxygalactose transaminase
VTLRLIPPVAVPVGALRVASTIVDRGADAGLRFAAELGRAVGRPAVSLFGSGRAALAAWLAACRRDGRDEVVMPAYTCWTVPAAAVRAGMRVRLVDVDPATLGPDPDAVACAIGARTAAVVAAHLFARSTAIEAIVERVRRADPSVPVLEDAAQAWPDPRACGAEAVLLSFGRGKPLPLGRGGAIAASATLAAAPAVRGGGWGEALALAATSVAARPRWYRIPEALPGLGIGRTVYDPAFDAALPLRAWQARLGTTLLAELPRLQAARTANAARLAAAIELHSALALPAPARAAGPIRLPVLAASRTLRDALLPALRRRGVSASAMYPGTLCEIAALAPHRVEQPDAFPGARELAARLLTLPVYPGLGDADVEAVARALSGALAEAGR